MHRDIKEAIDSMVYMTQEAFTPCLECGNSPIGEFREEELKEFAGRHPECVRFQREMRSNWQKPHIDVPDWRLVQPAVCFISGVCCDCCKKNHIDVWDMCRQARLDCEREVGK